MEALGVGPTEFANVIGLSPSYTNSLMNGSRSWEGTDRATKRLIAGFLGVPYISVLMLAEIVEPADFMYDDSIEETLDNAFRSIKSHKIWGSFCQTKTEWDQLPTSAKMLIALLFEKAAEIEIIGKVKMIEVVTPGSKKKPRKTGA